jgi:hypothetical protein
MTARIAEARGILDTSTASPSARGVRRCGPQKNVAALLVVGACREATFNRRADLPARPNAQRDRSRRTSRQKRRQSFVRIARNRSSGVVRSVGVVPKVGLERASGYYDDALCAAISGQDRAAYDIADKVRGAG